MNNQQKISNISLGIVAAAALAGMFFLPSIMSVNAQNATGSIDAESVKTHLDQAVESMDNGDKTGALKHIDLAEEQLEIAEDTLEQQLGQ